MTHLHIPDGVIPFPWLLLSFFLCTLLLGLAIYQVRREDLQKKVPRIGVISALMLLTMSIPLGIIPYHLNLTVLAGIILGPWLGFISIFLVNLILSLVGHGGITVVGLNSLIIGSEVFWGYYLFQKLKTLIRTPVAAGAATMITLIISSFLMIGMVGLTQVNPGEFLHHHEHGEQHYQHQDSGEEGHSEAVISLTNFASFILPLALLGSFIEALVTSLIVGYFLKVKPDIIETEYLKKAH